MIDDETNWLLSVIFESKNEFKHKNRDENFIDDIFASEI